jgi:probable rRNA maturation factor
MTHLIHIHADSTQSNRKIFLEQVAQVALHALDAPSCELTIVLTSEDHIRELNRRYGGTDRATDVLSFENESPDPDSGLMYKGDVVIAQSIAEKQAQAAGHTFEEELAILIVHGILHLFDYDHEDSADKEVMWELQNRILFNLNLKRKETRDSDA